MRSNCLLWAACTWWREYARWRVMGQPRGVEPRLTVRPSRLEPREVPHLVVTYCADYGSGVMVTESFVPADKRPLPWWRLWQALWTRGYVKDGDEPTTQPPWG